MSTVGRMDLPPDFKYLGVFLRGRPVHPASDAFARRHPAMDRVRRAKIFSSFDALKGFDDAVRAKDVLYIDRPEPDEDARGEIDRRLGILGTLSRRGRTAAEKHPVITVTCFVPCRDENSFAFGYRGQRARFTGPCRRIDTDETRTVTVGRNVIPIGDILSVDGDGLFDTGWETDAP